AVRAAHVGELGPLVPARVAREVGQRVAEGHGLPDRPRWDAVRLPARRPVRGHGLAVVVELEREQRMSGGDQLMIDLPGRVAEVAMIAAVRAHAKVAQIVHSSRHGLFMRPTRFGVLAAPAAGGTVTRLALHAILEIDAARDIRYGNVGGVAIEAERLLIRP